MPTQMYPFSARNIAWSSNISIHSERPWVIMTTPTGVFVSSTYLKQLRVTPAFDAERKVKFVF